MDKDEEVGMMWITMLVVMMLLVSVMLALCLMSLSQPSGAGGARDIKMPGKYNTTDKEDNTEIDEAQG